MNSSTLRFLWSVIEQIQPTALLEVSDTDLVKHLLKQLDNRKALNSEENSTISAYLYSRTALIRDLAMARLA
ncbi:MAG: hypothetical protein HXY43_25905 [Fischerella sp.]|jgi:hypothetical protein|uniref:hypothetical protein n=1 Tax=unclassified Fischerella TaxID=494603 RepID=UPI00047EC66A|nr:MULTISPECIES: hypothetical protein [unclassified Fischerella]NWF62575.1 hypothetical protein [Fischerella sp.]